MTTPARAATYRTIAVEYANHVATVVLDRPEVRNAFDATMMAELTELWSEISEDADVRCIVITGRGAGFCTGADANMLADRQTWEETARDELAFLPRHRVRVPVIVAVNGVCAGGGLHFVGDGDIVIASSTATFLDPHVSVGQVTALEPLMLAVRARFDAVVRMALLGRSERLDADAARAAGLVSEVVDPENLLARAQELAAAIAANSPQAVARSRQALLEFENALIEGHLETGWVSIREHWSHPDAKEGPAAFLARRSPQWVQ